ncbi:saccharopine dehydrogenase NADP-binding domain-containing protein [Aquimarina sp. ERC-38]|uniref:saccharopine dehydrogenase family protein n=1 Tax=Aquimarina sp. ERC-38 TaxID=2949996 RepID=UPI002245A2EC|nr:saccharopine dehydrogenase family protein [Aquimarina sp. ERC-38]UZO82021.1 saccharopine dehydrogenase NADP-binding domain-containing protein [Aquimarina sp. ERC-38]
MKTILIIGAGKSTSVLISYLHKQSFAMDFQIQIADKDVAPVQKIAGSLERCQITSLDIFNEIQRRALITKATIVISMLPARFHIIIAKDCLNLKKHLITASYVSPEMQALHKDAVKNNLLFLNEMGVDPGIDHMSAMQIIDQIREQGGKMLLFESFTGGLIAPENDTNLWNYKFTWNPRNVVLAGQGGAAEFIQEGTYKYIPYHKLFRRTEFLHIEGYGKFEAYANRNSLHYREKYGLDNILTLYRGTMRRIGFSKAWNIFVQLGMTADNYQLHHSEDMSYRDFVNLFLAYSPTDSVELKLRHYLKIDQDDNIWDKLLELDIFSATKKIGIKNATPAQALQKILEDTWTLQDHEKDMIVMYHKFGYELNGQKKQKDATMVCVGKNATETAMAKTVGLPVGIAALQILKNKLQLSGVHIPINKEIYESVLNELKKHDIVFNEKESLYLGYNPNGVQG